MAEARPLTDRERYEQRACQGLVQHSGWREVLLPLVAQQLAETERLAARRDVPDGVRLGAVDQRQALLSLLSILYKKAEEPNPFDAARLTLWSTLLPPKEMPAPPESEATLRDLRTPQRRTSGGAWHELFPAPEGYDAAFCERCRKKLLYGMWLGVLRCQGCKIDNARSLDDFLKWAHTQGVMLLTAEHPTELSG